MLQMRGLFVNNLLENKDRLARAIGFLLLAVGCSHLIRKYFELPTLNGISFGIFIFFLLGYFLQTENQSTTKKTWWLWSFVPLNLLGVWYFFVIEFGAFDWDSILFHYNLYISVPGVTHTYTVVILQTFVGVILIGLGLLLLKNYSRFFRVAELWIAIALLAVNPALVSLVDLAIGNSGKSVSLYDYYSPVDIVEVKGKKPLNFIHIFLESAEKTFENKDVFGSVMDPVSQLRSTAFSANNLVQVKNTGWSMAGIVSTYCGVPLSALGPIKKNLFGRLDSILPSGKCIGDVLKPYNYDLTFLDGATITFGGLDKFFNGHGFNQLIGFDEGPEYFAERLDPELFKERTLWGWHDDYIFDASLELLKEKQKRDNPFGLVIRSVGGHFPIGHVAPRCKNNPEIEAVAAGISRGLKCANTLFRDFYDKALEQGLLKNTILIVQSDHLMMKSDLSKHLKKLDRTNLFLMLGDGVEVGGNSRLASMIDVYPTILEALGFELKDHRAGLGYSLLSKEKTLVDRLGIDALNKMIKHDRSLVNYLWLK